jgi:hypothetical protein
MFMENLMDWILDPAGMLLASTVELPPGPTGQLPETQPARLRAVVVEHTYGFPAVPAPVHDANAAPWTVSNSAKAASLFMNNDPSL